MNTTAVGKRVFETTNDVRTKLLVFILLLLVAIVVFSLSSASAHASLLDVIKGIFPKEDLKKEFTIASDITLAPGGDENSNGQIDAGDIVRFTYTIRNTTDQKYAFATLKTNIDRKQLNFIHNVYGVTGLTDNDDTIIFRNLRINPQEQHAISFDARINYYQEDRGITSEPEFITSENNSIVKAAKKDVKANRLTREEVDERLKKHGVTKNSEQEQ